VLCLLTLSLYNKGSFQRPRDSETQWGWSRLESTYYTPRKIRNSKYEIPGIRLASIITSAQAANVFFFCWGGENQLRSPKRHPNASPPLKKTSLKSVARAIAGIARNQSGARYPFCTSFINQVSMSGCAPRSRPDSSADRSLIVQTGIFSCSAPRSRSAAPRSRPDSSARRGSSADPRLSAVRSLIVNRRTEGLSISLAGILAQPPSIVYRYYRPLPQGHTHTSIDRSIVNPTPRFSQKLGRNRRSMNV
jgi:hypothetical protein